MKKTLYALLIAVMLAGLFVPAVAADDETMVSVIITAAGDVQAVQAEVERLGGQVTKTYVNFPLLVAEVTNDAAVTLSGLNIVESVSKNHIRTLEPPIIEETRDGAQAPNSDTFVVNTDGEDSAIEFLTAEQAADKGLPETYYNYMAVNAPSVWFAPDGNMGEDTIIAIVDTGVRTATVWPFMPPVNWCLGYLKDPTNPTPGQRIYEGYNATGDGVPATSIHNHWHGTHVAQVAGSNCWMGLVEDWPFDPYEAARDNALIYSLLEHNPDGIYADPYTPGQYWIPLLGPAPHAEIYPVKVFPTDGSGVPDSIIIDGLDHLLTVKAGGLDIDVVNMSLGGATLYDGYDAYRAPLRALKKAGMLVVTSAGNAGPVPNSIGSPATDFRALSVGATDDPAQTSVFREFQGQFWGYDGTPLTGDESADWGHIARPNDDVRVTTFSSRGPLSDGRMGPDVAATGLWHFAGYFVYDPSSPIGVSGIMRWAGGTSFSSPLGAGAAALLNTWWEQNHPASNEKPGKIHNALMLGSDPDKISDVFEERDTGFGYLDIPAAWMLLKANAVPNYFINVWDHKLYNNIGWDCDDNACVYESDLVTLGPAETFDKVFSVDPVIHDEIYVELFDVVGDQDNVFWNTADLWVKSAKRTASPYVIDDLAPLAGGNAYIPDPGSAWVRVRDGETTYGCGGPCYSPVDANLNWAMEPGQWKVTVAPYDWDNAPVSFRLRITKPFRWDPPGEPWVTKKIWTGKDYYFFYDAAGLSKLTFDLSWNRDWSKFPTNDIDLIVIGPDSTYYFDGATLSAPEKLVIDSPMDGTYTVIVSGYEVYGKDTFKLYVTPEYP